MEYVIKTRKLQEYNNDPQRRCYYGCHYSTAFRWTEWENLEHASKEDIERRLRFWRDLNDYAVNERGKGAKRDFKVSKID